jgi:putative tryptophan/tyrosine transport system substrate-binding protein
MINKRLTLVVPLALGLLAVPIAGQTQPTARVYRIGYLSPGAASGGVSGPFRDALKELGYIEGRNLVIESRFADTKLDQLPGLAKDLVRVGVDIIVTIGTPTVQAAKEATTTIPIVMAGSADPVEHKLVASLASPGGNVTGVTHSPGPQISGKGLQLLKEAVPAVSRVAILWDSSGLHEGLSLDAQRAVARTIGVKLLPMDVKTLDELTTALATAGREHANGLFVFPNFINGKHEKLILGFAATNRLPTMFQAADSVAAGGLMSYYSNWAALRQRAAVYVNRILKGAKPADLPVEQPTKFELVINLKTAKALGLTIPPQLLTRADHVIE